MAIRKIVYDYEDIIRKKSREVTEFNQKLWDLLDDMAETMYNADGVGLAAVQIGILRRIAVVDTGENLYELINPIIIEKNGEQTGSEG
ncbi:MAG: peptide deformylase, partial [Oscillospiraceae bacterium]